MRRAVSHRGAIAPALMLSYAVLVGCVDEPHLVFPECDGRDAWPCLDDAFRSDGGVYADAALDEAAVAPSDARPFDAWPEPRPDRGFAADAVLAYDAAVAADAAGWDAGAPDARVMLDGMPDRPIVPPEPGPLSVRAIDPAEGAEPGDVVAVRVDPPMARPDDYRAAIDVLDGSFDVVILDGSAPGNFLLRMPEADALPELPPDGSMGRLTFFTPGGAVAGDAPYRLVPPPPPLRIDGVEPAGHATVGERIVVHVAHGGPPDAHMVAFVAATAGRPLQALPHTEASVPGRFEVDVIDGGTLPFAGSAAIDGELVVLADDGDQSRVAYALSPRPPEPEPEPQEPEGDPPRVDAIIDLADNNGDGWPDEDRRLTLGADAVVFFDPLADPQSGEIRLRHDGAWLEASVVDAFAPHPEYGNPQFTVPRLAWPDADVGVLIAEVIFHFADGHVSDAYTFEVER